MYTWFVFLHVLGVFGFLMAHGVSISVAFALRRERNFERVQTLLNLSASSIEVMLGSLAVLILSGVITGFMGHWWDKGWIWLSLVAAGCNIYLYGYLCRTLLWPGEKAYRIRVQRWIKVH